MDSPYDGHDNSSKPIIINENPKSINNSNSKPKPVRPISSHPPINFHLMSREKFYTFNRKTTKINDLEKFLKQKKKWDQKKRKKKQKQNEKLKMIIDKRKIQGMSLRQPMIHPHNNENENEKKDKKKKKKKKKWKENDNDDGFLNDLMNLDGGDDGESGKMKKMNRQTISAIMMHKKKKYVDEKNGEKNGENENENDDLEKRLFFLKHGSLVGGSGKKMRKNKKKKKKKKKMFESDVSKLKFNKEDKSVIKKLSELGYDEETVMKVFDYFERDEFATANFLLDNEETDLMLFIKSSNKNAQKPPLHNRAKSSFSIEDNDAIDVLVNLGFDRQASIQAYFAMSRDIGNSANFLLDQEIMKQQIDEMELMNTSCKEKKISEKEVKKNEDEKDEEEK